MLSASPTGDGALSTGPARRVDWGSLALLALAAALLLWVRLLPLSLPAIGELAPEMARQRLAERLAAEERTPATAGAPAARRPSLQEWINAHPADFEREVARQAEALSGALTYADGAGRRWPYLGDYDSYAWLRAARNQLQRGTVCDAVVDGRCRDELTLAPLGAENTYGRTPHVLAIAAVHRLLTALDSHFPLPASAYLVPVALSILGILPAFAIGRQLAGPIGGFYAALISGLHPAFLQRSLGSDNDVWNVVLPLYTAWALMTALRSQRTLIAVGGSLLAGAFTGLHSAEWRGWEFGFVVFAAGVLGSLLLSAALWVAQRRNARLWQAPRVRRAACILFGYIAATAVGTQAAGRADGPVSALWHAMAPPVGAVTSASSPAGRAVDWPSVLATVSELALPNLGAIATQSYGHLLFFVGWLGMLLLWLPRQQWQTGHFLVLIGGTLLYRYLLTASGLSYTMLIVLLALPLAAAAVMLLQQREPSEADDACTGVVVVTWLLAALLMSYRGTRFILLLAAPFGIAAGVAMGRLHGWLSRLARTELSRHHHLAGAVVSVAVLALAVLPVHIARRTAIAYLPAIDSAWAEAAQHLRATSPPDAIVNTWWDYGYWTKYLAERRVSVDGGTLLTHVPHWLARAQVTASETEAVGLLRMLNCGSAATSDPEAARSAYTKLTQGGMDALGAYAAIVRLASLDRAAADRDLAALGLEASERDAILAATHCTPPPSYLVLSSRQTHLGGWWRLGAWDAGRAYIAGPLRTRSEDEAIGELVTDLRYREDEARDMVHAAASADEGARARFVTPPGRLLTPDWVSCEATADGRRRCPISVQDPRAGWIDGVEYADSDGRSARLLTSAQRDDPTVSRRPDRVSIATGDAVETADVGPTEDTGLAVLIDGAQHRALVGTPLAIQSLFVRLMYLDGRGVRSFRKVDERTSGRGQRVVTWAIDWAAAAPSPGESPGTTTEADWRG
jgi:dolichyl-diphosphooligosaccharide--protein glycosyltransferase